jgi:hypothetical protein
MVLTVPLAAADAGPRFFLEDIRVTGIRWSSETVVAAESRLHRGRVYSESELRDAVSRIQRLPFVLHAEFRLEKGSAREQYVLIVAVDETAPLFAELLFRTVVLQNVPDTPPPGSPPDDPPRGGHATVHLQHGTFGARWFTGAKGVLHAGIEVAPLTGGGTPQVSAGYTHYNLLGSGATLSLLATYRDRGDPPAAPELRRSDEVSYSAVAAVPLFANQSLRANWDRESFPVSDAVFRRDSVKLGWRYDTTDDPLLPSRGTAASTTFILSEEPSYQPNGTARTRRTRDVSAEAARYWALTPRQSVHAASELTIRGGAAADDWSLRLGYSGSLRGRRAPQRYGDIHVELTAERVFYDFRGRPTESYAVVAAGLACRNRWGVARFQFQYLGWRNLDR